VEGTANDLPQVYNPETNTIRDLSAARIALWKWYPFMFVAPNGRVFNAGPLAETRYLDTSGTGRWTFVDNTRSGWFREEGTSVMYDVGKVLIMGGGDPPMASAASYRGYHSTALLLPDARVLVTGGDKSPRAHQIYSPPYLFLHERCPADLSVAPRCDAVVPERNHHQRKHFQRPVRPRSAVGLTISKLLESHRDSRLRQTGGRSSVTC
jgi:hypothetical protein